LRGERNSLKKRDETESVQSTAVSPPKSLFLVSINSFYKEKFNENSFIFQKCQKKLIKPMNFVLIEFDLQFITSLNGVLNLKMTL